MKILLAIFTYWIARGILEGSIWWQNRVIYTFILDYHTWRLLESGAVFLLFIALFPLKLVIAYWLVAVFIYHRLFHFAQGRIFPINGRYRILGFTIRYKWWQRLIFEGLHLVIGILFIL